jgi:hypothetical protein
MKGVTNPYQMTEAVETSLSYLASLHDRNETPFFALQFLLQERVSPRDLIDWTEGCALVSTDGPFPPVKYNAGDNSTLYLRD